MTVTSPTTALAQLKIDPGAAGGPRTVTVATGLQQASRTAGFSVTSPSLVSLSPNNGQQGQVNLTLVITGQNTHFSAVSVVTFSGSGITVGAPTAAIATSLTLQVSIAANAPMGAQAIQVVTGAETVSLANAFSIVAGTPIITRLNPNGGLQGQLNLSATIGGNFTHFSASSVVTFSGTGITAGAPTAATLTSLTVPVSIAANAPLGAQGIQVVTGTETVSLANGFTVTAGTPAITLVNPNVGRQGQTNLSVIITGEFTHFTQGTTAVSFGVGVTVVSLTVSSPSMATAIVSIDPATTPGTQLISVTTGAEVVSLPGGFSVSLNHPPVITSLPASGPVWENLPALGGPPPGRDVGNNPNSVYDDANDRLIFFSGDWFPGPPTPDVWVLANASGRNGVPTWSQLAPAAPGPGGREAASLTYVKASNRLIVCGGTGPSDCWVLTNANGLGGAPSWIRLPDMPNAIFGSAAYDPTSGRLMVFGFVNATTNNFMILSNADGIGTPAWTQLTVSGPTPPSRIPSSVAYDVATNRLILFGGVSRPTPPNATSLNDLWILTNANGLNGTPQWVQLSPVGGPPAGRRGDDFSYDSQANDAVLFGGAPLTVFDQFGADARNDALSDLWLLKNANGIGVPQWIQLSPVGRKPIGHFYSAMGRDSANQVLPMALGRFEEGSTLDGSGLLLLDNWRLRLAAVGAPVGALFTYSVAAGDPDGDNLSFSLTQSPAGMTISPTTGLISFVPNAAQLGSQSVTVRADDGKGLSSIQTFQVVVVPAVATISPSVVSVSPNIGQTGTTIDITVTCQNAHLVSGQTAVYLYNGKYYPEPYAESVTVLDNNTAVVRLSIPSNAPLGSWNLNIYDGFELARASGAFTVQATPVAPSITSISPNSGPQGGTVTVAITGQNTHFAQGVTQPRFGAGITVTALTINSPTGASAVLTIDPAASLGTRTVTLTTGTEIALLSAGFAVTAIPNQPPTVTAGPNQTISLPFDDFEGPSISSFWTQTGPGTATLTQAAAYTGSQSLQLTESPTFPWTANLVHNYSFPQSGTVSVRMKGDQLCCGSVAALQLGNTANNWTGLIQQSKNPTTCLSCFTARSIHGSTEVDYPFTASPSAWHLIAITVNASGVTMNFDGVNVFSDPSVTSFDALSLSIWSGNGGTAYFDDFAATFATTTLNGTMSDDGEPLGALLATSWSATASPGVVSFSNPTGSFPDIAGQSVPVSTGAAFGAPGKYLLDLNGTDSQLSNNSNVTVTVTPAPPMLVTVSPNGAQPGQQNLSMSLIGVNTNFIQGISTVSIGPGIIVSTIIVIDKTHLTAQISIGASASLGPRTVTVISGAETATLSNAFTVTASAIPALDHISPNSGVQGQGNVIVSITGLSTHFVQGATTISFGADIAVNNETVTTSTNLTANITIPSIADLGVHTVTVTTGSEIVALANGFTVATTATPPIVNTLSPNSGQQGQTNLSVTIIGQFTHFNTGSIVTFNGSGIAAGTPTAATPTSLTVPLSIAATAPLGAQGIQVVTGTEAVSLANVFTVTAGAPMITQVNPNSGQQGQQTLTVAIKGQLTHFLQGVSTVDIGPAVTINSVIVADPTDLTVQFAIAGNAPLGPHTVTVTTGNEIAILNNGFDIVTSTNVCTPAPGGLAGWWPGDGNANDISGNGLNGSTTGNVTFVTGWVQQAFHFDGMTSLISVPAAAPLDIRSAITIVAWISPNAVQPFPVPNTCSPDGITRESCAVIAGKPNGYQLAMLADGRLTLGLATHSNGVVDLAGLSTSKVSISSFTFVVATYDSATAEASIYINGVLDATNTFSGVMDSTNEPFQIGGFVDPSFLAVGYGAYAGVIDEAILFNRALSANEIQSVYLAGRAGMCKNTPVLLSASPSTVVQGQRNVQVALAGQFTHWSQGATAVTFGAGITVAMLTINSATSATALLNIDPAATGGRRSVTITTAGEVVTLANAFTVGVNQPPVVSAGANQTLSLLLASVQITEFAIPTSPANISGPPEITVGPDGNLWFTEESSNKVGTLTTGGKFIEFQVPTSGGALLGIAAGPDGNVWFTEYFGNTIWRITPAGILTPFSIPTAGSAPYGITAGPDGNLWFTERFANKIGRITPGGVFSEFPIPSTNSQPFKITVGPDGNLWFTESGDENGVFVGQSKIGRITLNGVITEFPVPTARSAPIGITAGSDGNLWFTEAWAAVSQIGRITPAGVVTEYPLPTAASSPLLITAGPDGNLWFTEGDANQIGRITTSGAVAEYPVPTPGSLPQGITAGPDGNLWFTETAANQIARANFGVFYNPTNAALNGLITDDGLPVGGALTTAWSETNGPAPVIFGGPNATFSNVAGQTNPVSTSATLDAPGTYTLSLAGSDSALTTSSTLTITVNPPQAATLLSVTPNNAQPGQQNVAVTIVGAFTHFAQNTSIVNLGTGITVASFAVSSPTTASAVLNIDSSALPGPRRVTVTTGSEVATLGNAFTVQAGMPAILSLSPNVGQQGQTKLSITITGQLTHFAQGSSTADLGAGITVLSLSVSSSSSATAVVNIDPTATGGPRTVTVTTGNEIAGLTNGFTVLAVAVPPTIKMVSPNSGPQGQGGPVGIVGQNTHFVQGTTQVSFGPGITVSNISVTCPTCLTAQLQIAANAAVGPATVTVTTGSEVATLTGGFTIFPGTPILTSMVPASASQGQSLTSTITGQFTHWTQGTTQVSLGAGITVTSVTVSSATSLSVQLAVDPAATIGTRALTVTTGAEVASAAGVLTVQAATSGLYTLNPGGGSQGQQNLSVVITGLATHFAQGTSVASFGAGVTVASLTVASATSATAIVNIDPAAIPGARTVTLTTGAEVVSFTNGFTISASGPIVYTLNPGGSSQGATGLQVQITGLNTHFTQGTSVATFGAGINVSSLTITNATTATAMIDINVGAAIGPRTVTITTGAEIASFVNGFTVVAGIPGITQINPGSGAQGVQNLSLAVIAQFTHFVQGTTTATIGSGVTINSVTVTDSTHLSLSVSASATAATGSRTVTITTGTEIVSAPGGFVVTAGTPTLLSANPASATQSQQNVNVTVTGQLTHFVQSTSSVSFGGAGVTVNSVTVASATSLTANISVSQTATAGSRTIIVTTGAEVDTLANAFTVQAVGNQPPAITIASTWSVVLPNSLTLNYTVSDPGLPHGGTLTVNWSTVSGAGGVGFQNQTPTSIMANFSQAGSYVLQIGATDSFTQLTTTQNVTVTVTGTLPTPPTVSITSPTDGSPVTTLTNVIGSVASPALSSWTLEFHMQNESIFRPIATGTTAVTNATLGTFDPTLLLNGLALIQLRATDTAGQTTTFGPISVVVMGNQKLGNFTISFNDLSVPVAGLPIQVVRTYDSRDKAAGDFGVGWRLNLTTVSLATNGALGDNWVGTNSGGLFSNYCISQSSSHVVTVTFADGTVFQFQPTLTPACQQLVPLSQTSVTFAPISTTPPNASLAIVGSSLTFIDGSFPGAITLLDVDDVTTFAPDLYRLTMPDGRVLLISQSSGLQSMTDPNGNKLTITAAGITHSSGKSVSFLRNQAGAITKITDPNGNIIQYGYDANNNLISVRDAAGNTSMFTYDGNHGLLTIVDPRGVQPIKNVYDNAGRLIQHVDAFGNTINYSFNLNTQQETVTDRLGNLTVNYYDANGNIVQVTDALGGNTLRTYDAKNNLLTETNALHETRTYTYDTDNNRLTETDSLGHTTTYTYNNRNQVLTITDALGGVTTNTYDGSGNLLTTKDAAGDTTSYAYNGQGLRTSMTDALGNITAYQYDGSGNLTQQTDALGHVSSYTYDGNGNKLSVTQTRTTPTGPQTMVTSYQYDPDNRLTKTTYPDTSTTQIAYNAIGKQSATTDQLGHQRSYQYDLMGRLTKTTYPDGVTESSTYDAEGDRITSIDRASRTTGYVYDPLKRLVQTIYADQTKTGTTYDVAGEVTTVTDARGDATQYQYDQAGRRNAVIDALGHKTSFTYDAVGNQISMTDANGHTTQYQYDADNRRTKVIYPDGTTDTTGYDALGRTISKTDQAGQITQYAYDKPGHLIQVTDALSQKTQYAYDEVGNRLTQTDANGHTTNFAYDSLGRRTQRTLPLGMAETSTYDPAGNLQSKKDFNGKTTTYTYDLVNRLLTKTPDPSLNQPTVQFTYSPTGQRLSMLDASGTTGYAYDVRDHLTQKVTSEGTLTYGYDGAGNLLSIHSSNTGGTSVNYAYDALNRLSTVTDNRLAAGTTSYAFDNVGNLQSFLYPNGVQSTYTYNTLNRLTNAALNKGSTLASYAYTLGQAGNRLAVAELGGRQITYTYDALYRLTRETIAAGSVNGVIGYTYDPVGNRLTRTSTAGPVPATTSTYDANDRLNLDTYDADGNTTASGGNAYAYDFENRLTSQNGGAVSIVYDGDGNRVSKTVGATTTKYLVDDRNLTGYAQVLEELSGGMVQRVYTYGLNRISQSQASGTSFYGYDGHGNVRLLTDTTGAVTDRYDYDAFGNTITQAGNTPDVYQYSGEQNDPNLGLYYLRARYLSQSTGRFWTTDKLLGDEDTPVSMHQYLYAGSDPVDNSDPSGNQFIASEIPLEAAFSVIAQIPVLAPSPSVFQHLKSLATTAVEEETNGQSMVWRYVDLSSSYPPWIPSSSDWDGLSGTRGGSPPYWPTPVAWLTTVIKPAGTPSPSTDRVFGATEAVLLAAGFDVENTPNLSDPYHVSIGGVLPGIVNRKGRPSWPGTGTQRAATAALLQAAFSLVVFP